jgi:DNA repair exonuclease SbcCD ATPase subunit
MIQYRAAEIEQLQQQVQEYSALTQSQDEKIRGLVELEKRYKAQQVEINQLRSKLVSF